MTKDEYTYAGYTWSKKGVKRRTAFWNKLGYSVKAIPTKNGKMKSKYMLYVKKRRK
jgi:hypothetical protein